MDEGEDSKVDGFFPDGLKPTNLLKSTFDKTALVWDFVNEKYEEKQTGHVRVYLRPPPPSELAAAKEEVNASSSASKSTDDMNIEPNKQKDEGDTADVSKKDNNNDNNDEKIEESMLQYQRQLRKTQAAKRAGAILTKEQLEIVYEDDSIAIVNKPAGVLTVPGINNNDSISNLLFARIQEQQQKQQGEGDNDNNHNDRCQDATESIIHRLDMDTAGLVVFGKTKSVVSTLHQVFRRETQDQQNQRNKKRNNNNRKRKKHSRLSVDPRPSVQTNQQRTESTSESLHTTDISGDDPTSSKPSAASKTDKASSSASSPLWNNTDNHNHNDDVVVKEYEALVCGHIPLEVNSGFIDLPLQRDIHHPPFMRVSTPTYENLARQVVDALRERKWTKLSKRNPKSSQTKFRVIQREYYCGKPQAHYDVEDDDDKHNNSNKHPTSTGADGHALAKSSSSLSASQRIPVTRLSLIPITGRTHQLRVHCAAMGFPIVGDPVYGLYGESAFAGGLFHNPVEVVISGESHINNNTINSNHKFNASIREEPIAVAVDDRGSSTEHKSSSPSSSSLWRAPVSLQKQIMEVHPPGVKDMCLHAKKLGFPHPITKIMREWEVKPKF